MKKKFLAVLITAVFSVSPVYAVDENTATEEPLELRRIMRDMGDDMETITRAISREDWILITKISPKIADHPQPPLSEKVRILAFAGTDISKFKNLDGKTHASARELGNAAAREDGYAVIDEFATLQKTCLACHQYFRKPFQEHFYNNN